MQQYDTHTHQAGEYGVRQLAKPHGPCREVDLKVNVLRFANHGYRRYPTDRFVKLLSPCRPIAQKHDGESEQTQSLKYILRSRRTAVSIRPNDGRHHITGER